MSKILVVSKVNFYINYEEDLHYVLFRLTKLDPAGLDKRLKDKDIDAEVVEKILKTDNEGEKLKILDGYLSLFYEKNKVQLEKVKNEYQSIWFKNAKKFFPLVTKLMGNLPWNHDEYLFLVSSLFSRAQWGKGNRLAVWWRRNPQNYWYLNGYELVLSHFFEIVDQLYDNRPVSDWHLWALAESVAYILVFKENELKNKIWPGLVEPKTFSYPQLIKHINFLYPKYRKLTFKKFVIEAIDYIKGFPQEEFTKSI